MPTIKRAYTLIGTALYHYNTDHGSYPSGKTSTDAFKQLFPTYLQNPKSLFLTQAGGHKAFTSSSTDDLTKVNVCWTITMNNGAGLTEKDPLDLLLLLSDLGGDYPKFPAGGTIVTLTDNNIWGTDGVTIARMDQSTTFLRQDPVALTGNTFKTESGANYQSIAP